MKRRKWTKAAAIAGISVSAATLLVLSVPNLLETKAEKATCNQLFDFSSSSLGYKNLQSDGASTKKGLMLYAYESGVKASFKGELGGIFNFDGKAVSSLGSLGLKRYSLVFTDLATKKNFAVDVNNYSAYSDVDVRIGEEKAGICYYHVTWNGSDRLNGYSAGANLKGNYTKFTGNEAKIVFDPTAMTVKTIGDNGADLLVWDFTKTYNDGKRFNNNLVPFKGYTVDVVFNDVIKDDRGALLLYNFGGYNLASTSVEEKVTLRASIENKAIVGTKYTVPSAIGNSILKGTIPSNAISLKIFDENGKVLNTDGSYAFTPANAGTYYLYYYYATQDGKENGVFYALQAINSSEVTYAFTYSSAIATNNELGLHATMALPSGTITSPLMNTPTSKLADIAIIKDGATLKEEKESAGFTYAFDSLGTYSVVYSLAGGDVREIKYVNISSKTPFLSGATFANSYTLGASLTLQNATLYVDDTTTQVSPKMTYPSGKTATAGAVALDELGNYSISYSYQENGATKEQAIHFVVHESYASLFTGTGDTASFGEMEANNTYSGVKLSLGDKLPMVYHKDIDISDNIFDNTLADRSQNTPLIDLYSSPHVQGTGDAEGLYIVLTDQNDENNQIVIRVKNLSYSPNCTFIRTKAKGQNFVGYYYNFMTTARSVDSATGHEEGGFNSGFDMTHKDESDDFSNNHLLLYFDNSTNRLYGKPWQLTGHNITGDPTDYDSLITPWLVRDYSTNDQEMSGGDNAWSGFTSSKVNLSIYAAGVSSSADFYIRSIDGEDLSQEFVTDDKAPDISLKFNESTMPKAQVGVSYPLPEFTATDSYSAVVSQGVDVYRGNTLIQENATAFTPNVSGTYTLSYHASDAFGNTSHKEFTLEAKSKLDSIAITIDGSLPTNAKVGQSVSLPTASATGGAGDVAVTTSVKDSSGADVPVSDNSIFLSKEGTYIVTYTAKDYIGNSQKKYLYLTGVSYSASPVYDENSLVLPKAFIDGDPYTFGTYLASYYAANQAPSTIHATISVTDANGTKSYGENDVYTPTASASVTTAKIVFSFKGASGTSEITREIPLVSVGDSFGFMKDYFKVTNATTSAGKNGITMSKTSSGSPMDFTFIRSLLVQGFTFSFNAGDTTKFSMLFEDLYQGDEKASLAFSMSNGQLYVESKGSAKTQVGKDSSGKVTLSYDAASARFSDSNGNVVASFKQYENGSEFKGFSSGHFYWSTACEDGATFLVSSIDNQSFNDFRIDATEPVILLDGEISGHYNPGTKLHLPAAQCFDVLSEASAITMTISRDGAVVATINDVSKGYDYTPTEYGSYDVIYTCQDVSGNVATKKLAFTISDPVGPTLSFASEVPTSAKLGEKLTLPKYTVNDNNPDSVKVYVSYLAPNGAHGSIDDGTITFTQKGFYIIHYLAVDANDNYQLYTFNVVVA